MNLVEMSKPESAKRALMSRLVVAVLTGQRKAGLIEQVLVEMSCIPDDSISGDPEYVYKQVTQYIDWATNMDTIPRWYNDDWISENW